MRKQNILTSTCVALAALILAAGTTAFKKDNRLNTKFTGVSFHFKPANGSESAYENDLSWELATGDAECDEGGDPCIIIIDDSKLTGAGTQPVKLKNYLASQGGMSSDYPSAVAAVNALTTSQKP